MTTTRDADEPPRRKTVLFCPACSHEAPTTEGWIEWTSDGVRTLVCPVCGVAIDQRTRHTPRPPAEAD